MTQYSFGQTIPVLGPNIGFQGTVSRFGERVIAAREFVPTTTTNNLNFGDPAVVIQNNSGGYFDSVADFIAAAQANVALLAAQFAGVAVREVKTMLTYPAGQTPGIQQVGYYSNGQMAEVLERGNIVVLITVSNSPVSGSQLYTRVVANAAVPAGFVGDWEVGVPAASDQFTDATTLTEGSTAATATSGTNIQVGQLLSGPGIASGTYVAAVSGTSVTLSKAAIATYASTGALLTYSNLFAVPNCVARTGNLDSNNMLEITIKVRNAA
jgi:hypothetical protein